VLKSIWKLDNVAAATTFATAGSFDTYLKSSRWVENAIVRPEAVIGPRVGVRDKQFTTVDFRRCVFRQITFTKCRFVDCIFLGASFEECDFHDCRFVDCNMWKPTFERVYLDPSSFSFGKRYRQDSPNVPLVMYDRLYQVVRGNERLEHLLMADIQRRRWKRRETFYKAKRERSIRLWWRYVLNLFFDGISEYGYAPIRFLIISSIMFTILVVPIHIWWSELGFQRGGQAVAQEGFGLTLFYCASIFTTLGYSDLIPFNGLGRAVSTVIAFAGIGWSGLFTAILVRKVLR
jgi:pentapeptide repeat protein/ion channel